MSLNAIIAAAAAAGALALAAPAAAANLSKSVVPGYPDVVGEYLQVPGYRAPGTPAGLNTATFLRLRAAADGETPRPANAVIVGLPGFSSTPPHWLFLGSQLVHRAQAQTCDGKPCRVEVWVLQRRGAQLADTTGLKAARAKRDPKVALDYYFGQQPITQAWPGKGAPARIVGPGPGARWTPLTQSDLAFMADWDFQAYAGDVDAMIAQIRRRSGGKNIFLAGHSQGGGFVANYAARLQGDGKRGVDKLSGLIFLDGGPSAGQAAAPTEPELKAYFDRVAALRTGKAKVYTDASGMLGPIAGPASAMSQSVTGLYYAYADPNAEAVFPLRVAGMAPGPGDDFLKVARLSWLARAGASFDTDPVVGGGVQIPVLRFLGQGMGVLDFKPQPGTQAQCDKTPEPAMMMGPPRSAGAAPTCTASAAMVDPDRVYGWTEAGGNGTVNEPGKAMAWLQSQAWAPARANVRPVTVTFRDSGAKTIDAASMVGSNWYASERWDYDAGFFGRYRTLKLDRDGVKLDIDKTAIANIPVYVARQSPAPAANNPFPGVSDYTEINKAGTWQTDQARAITAFDPKINTAIYFHTDYVSADDSTPQKGRPGEPGHSAVAATLTDWVLKRSKGAAVTPTPKSLGVRDIY
ncbi:alpha/beta hydrolase [Phenylobacterium sp.]|uniref:alpha/beta hydrolase n=1 Tax=Phenylobacterium sp. TaxID=1871053 RepID=UPI003982F3E6